MRPASVPNDPEPDAIYVLKDGARLGPYTVDDVLDLIDEGTLSYDDVCLRAGAVETERLRKVLDWEGDRDEEIGRKKPDEDEEDTGDSEEWDDDEEQEEAHEDDDEDQDSTFTEIEEFDGPPRDPNLILYAGHPSVLSFPRTLFFIAAALAGGFYGRDHSQWWFFGGLVAALLGVSWVLLERSLKLYLITPRRVEIVTGLIAKSTNEVRIDDIRTINVRTPGLRGLFGVGTVEFASAGGSSVEVTFTDVYAAHRIKGLVRRIQDALDED